MRPIITAAMIVLSLLSAPAGAQVADSAPRLRIPPADGPKSVTTARVLAIVPSAGHIYAGEGLRGLGFLGGMAGVLVIGTAMIIGDCVGGLSAPDPECGENDFVDVVVPAAFFGIWGWSIYDAGLAARRTNARGRLGSASALLSSGMMPARAGHDVLGLRLGLRLGLP